MLSTLLALTLSVADPLGFPPVGGSLATVGAATPTATSTSTSTATATSTSTATATPTAPPTLTLPATPGFGLGNLVLPGAALALLAVVTLLMKRRTTQESRLVRVLETTSLGPKRALVVARLGDELLVIGSSEAGLHLLAARPAGEETADATAARLRAVPDLATAPARPAPGQNPLAAMLGRLRGPRGQADAPTGPGGAGAALDLPAFDALLAESAEDQELRRKLARGQSGERPVIPLAVAASAMADSPISISVQGGGSAPVKLFLLLTALSFATALLVSVTSFTRIVIVLSFLRQALGTPQLPPNQVLLGLALILSFFVMGPTANRVYAEALTPYMEDRIGHVEALEKASGPLREFMLKQTRDQDLQLFYEISGRERPASGDAMPMSVVMPAFMISELTTAFRMGLFLYIPLLLVDVLVATLLMSMGMMMVPPTLIALPVKVALFLMADGWRLVVSSIVRSFG